MGIHKKSALLALSLMVVFIGYLDSGSNLGSRQVIVWENSGFKGRNISWTWDPTIRHKLVPHLPGWFNDKMSSIQVGSEVKVQIFRHANYAGPYKICTESGNLSSYWNDEVSSLVIFPKALDRPLGVVISDRGFNTITSSSPRTMFFPLPESVQDREANYPWVTEYMNDRAQHVKIQGITVAVTLYEDVNFGGFFKITLPSSSCSPNATYKSGGHICFRLSGCSRDMDGNVSSLKVRWFGPQVYILKKSPSNQL